MKLESILKETAGTIVSQVHAIEDGLTGLADRVSNKFFRTKKGSLQERNNLPHRKVYEYLDTESSSKFIQGMFGAAAIYIATSIGVSETLSHTNIGPEANAYISLGSSYVTGYAAFLANDAKNYPEDWKGNKVKVGANKLIQAFKTFIVPEIAYIIGKPLLHTYLMKEGIDEGQASAIADLYSIPAFWAMCIPFAKKFGFIK